MDGLSDGATDGDKDGIGLTVVDSGVGLGANELWAMNVDSGGADADGPALELEPIHPARRMAAEAASVAIRRRRNGWIECSVIAILACPTCALEVSLLRKTTWVEARL